MKKILLLGAAGFVGQHLEYRLKRDGHFVVSVGRSQPKYRPSIADEFHQQDLRRPDAVHYLLGRIDFDEVYQAAGDVGGLGHIGVGSNDFAIMSNSALININVLKTVQGRVGKILFTSSQCVYPSSFVNLYNLQGHQESETFGCKEDEASFDTFPFAQEKLFSERLYAASGMPHAIARLGNTFGPYCTWDGPRAKAPAAICRKVAEAPYAGTVDLWGDGMATRSFTYVDDVVDGLIRLMAADYAGPVNIASSEMVTIAGLFETVCSVAGKIHAWRPTPGPEGVRGRNSDNGWCQALLGWEPTTSLEDGLRQTYPWISEQCLTNEIV
jgi:GDP-D-mannose 3', 5'-epimerase